MREENRGEQLLLATHADRSPCRVEDKGRVILAIRADAETGGNEEIAQRLANRERSVVTAKSPKLLCQTFDMLDFLCLNNF